MGSSVDGKFIRWRVDEMGSWEMGSARDGEFRRWGIAEKRSSVDE